MGRCIDIVEVRAKKFFLNMLDKEGSKTMWDFSQSLKVELIKDPHNVYMPMDVLWDCNDTVPNWFCQTWKKNCFTESSLSRDISSYSGLMRGIKEEVEGIISDELYTYALPEYCLNKSLLDWNCWICERRKGLKDCEGNCLPELLCIEEAFKKWDFISMEDKNEFGIRIGRNEDNEIIIQCVHCNTTWNEDRDDFCMVAINENPSLLSFEYQEEEKFKRIQEGMENKVAEWFICPLNCHSME